LPAGVRIRSRAFDSWNVEFRLDVAELLDQQTLLRHLREIKQGIANLHSLPETSLIFDGIVRKERTESHVDVVVRIKKQQYEKGAPAVHFKEGIGADETRYSHMTALIDIFYLDEFERVVTHDRLMQAVRQSRVRADIVDDAVLLRKLEEALATQAPIRNVVIARGQLPEIGSDAEIQFYFQAVAEPGHADQYYSSRRVSRGDLLCRKIPPTAGQRDGMNVLGDRLMPRNGLDIELLPGANAALSLDGSEIVAEADGVVVISRQLKRKRLMEGVKEFPASVRVKVNPVLRLDGNQVHDITTSNTVEVVGNLKMGSRILTDCEVFISGDVEEGSQIEAADDVIVQGCVIGASLSSHGNVIANQGISNAQITARDQVVIGGHVQNSTISGDTVTLGSAAGSKILARKSVTLRSIETDEKNLLSTICVGMNDFFARRLSENEVFLEKARANMHQIEMIVGKEIADTVNSTNAQVMLMRLLARLRAESGQQSRQQVDTLRRLLEAIPPTRAMIEQKEFECRELSEKLSSRTAEDESIIVVRERIAARFIVGIDGVEAELEPSNGEVTIRRHDDELIIRRSESPSPQDE